MTSKKQLFTVGHSNHDIDFFLELLREHSINAVADVRQFPYSKYAPQYNKKNLKKSLFEAGIEYVFLGDLLGARPDDSGCYTENHVDFHRLARADFFQDGLERLKKGMMKFRIALMCAEKDPVMCHRTILICRNLRSEDIQILHILEDSSLEDNTSSEGRLLKLHKLLEYDLFHSRSDMIEEAYDRQGRKMAASTPDEQTGGSKQLQP